MLAFKKSLDANDLYVEFSKDISDKGVSAFTCQLANEVVNSLINSK